MTTRIILAICLCLALSACSTVIEKTRTTPMDDGHDSRSFGTRIDDEVIETKAQVNIRKAHEAMEDAHTVVVSYNGIVLLAGQVPNDEMKRLAETTVRELAGVRTVYSELEIKPATSAGVRTTDSWITAKVKTKMGSQSLSLFAQVKVVTVSGNVYLMGMVGKDDAELATAIASNVKGAQKVVKLFEYTDE